MEALKKLDDKAYSEHKYAVEMTDIVLKKENFKAPSSLIMIGDNEYRTVFENNLKKLAVLITTRISDGESCIVFTNSYDMEKAKTEELPKLKGKKFRLKNLRKYADSSNGRTNSIRIALVKLGTIPDIYKDKRIIEDCVKTDKEGEKYIDYNQFEFRRRLAEEYLLNYKSINSIKRKK